MKTIPQRDLRNKSGEILRKAERGQEFIISVGGRPVALLGPCPKRQWVRKTEVARVLRSGTEDPTFFDDIEAMGDATADLDGRWGQ
ncbi:MAG: type II toxin-antitoxin system prevent-host-death family antitoxin [Deltaproteobacteria bacterium]|nr:type II toxin-antitoxin system prevent-host-death family antitoxin [Deltaproteobacteria bacterium]